MTRLAGGVYYLYQNFIQPIGAFSIAWTVIITSAAILGGIGTLEGPLVGAAIAVLLQQYLAEYIGMSLIIQGAIVIAIMIIAPQGIVGTMHKARWYQAVGRIASVQSQKSITQPRPSAERPA